MTTRHFLSLLDFTPSELKEIIYHAVQLKAKQQRGEKHKYLAGKNLAMIFEKSSTRTRVSFEVGMTQLGGHALFLSSRDTQLGRGEPIADTARVLSRMVDFIMVRNDSQAQQIELAKYSQVPVINALSDLHHPCQLLADMQTFFELRGDIAGKKVAWIGDGNNVCHSFIHAARQFDFQLSIATPEGYEPNLDILNEGLGAAVITHDPNEAAENAALIVTDVWASMGDESESQTRLLAFKNYQVNNDLMTRAQSDALFMHCLPAHRGEEVSAEVIDGNQSVVWEEAENRLHAQKALLVFLNQ